MKEKMHEKLDELYNEYLNKKLDMLFKSNVGEIINNPTLRKGDKLYNKDILNKSSKYKIIISSKYNFIDEFDNLISKKWYDYAELFQEGYAIVCQNKQYNLIDVNGNIVLKKWISYEIVDIHNGYIMIRDCIGVSDVGYPDNAKIAIWNYNFIDMQGNLINDEWFNDDVKFKNGFGVILENKKRYIINEKGQKISDIGFDHIGYSKGDYIKVKKNNKWNLIDRNGNLICQKWLDYEYIEYFDGFILVNENPTYHLDLDKYSLISVDGDKVTNESYRKIYNFKDGYAIVRKEDKYNFIDKEGQIISDTWYDEVLNFNDGIAVVRLNNLFNYIDTNGNLLNNEWFNVDFKTGITEIYEGYVLNKVNGKYNFVDIKGKPINNSLYDDAYNFKNGFAIVKKKNKYNFIDKLGQIISDVWFDCVYDFENGYAKVKTKKGYNYINTKGQLINNLYHQKEFFFPSNLIDYKITKTLFGYKCETSINSFIIKYKPYYAVNSFYTLCYNDDECYLYDRLNDDYISIGKCVDICIVNNIIFDYKESKVYLINDTKIIDITEYYFKNLSENEEINIRNIKTDILTRDEFSLLNADKIEQILSELYQETKKETKKIKEEDELKKIKEAQEEEEIQRKEKEKKLKENLDALNSKFKDLEENIVNIERLTGKKYDVPKIRVNNILVEVEDHLEINPIFINRLRFIDLTLIKFDNVKMSGIDFSNCNLILNPQKVYNKDLRNCNFEGVYISPFVHFDDVDIRGAKFRQDEDIRTPDFFNLSFERAIYDETTTYNGKPLTEIFDKKNQK